MKRDGVRITLGFNAQVNVTLAVASLNETLVVSGESPVVDTTATRLQTNYDQERLASMPNARDMWSLLATTPSVTLNRVDVGGATMGTQTTYFAWQPVVEVAPADQFRTGVAADPHSRTAASRRCHTGIAVRRRRLRPRSAKHIASTAAARPCSPRGVPTPIACRMTSPD